MKNRSRRLGSRRSSFAGLATNLLSVRKYPILPTPQVPRLKLSGLGRILRPVKKTRAFRQSSPRFPKTKIKKFLAIRFGADITTYISSISLPGEVSYSFEERAMTSVVSADLDLIEELRLRRWARENYVPRGKRETSWHHVVHDEMGKKDGEGGRVESHASYTWLKS
jgi:hypothetical protein